MFSWQERSQSFCGGVEGLTHEGNMTTLQRGQLNILQKDIIGPMLEGLWNTAYGKDQALPKMFFIHCLQTKGSSSED